jgi:hypothetical protein
MGVKIQLIPTVRKLEIVTRKFIAPIKDETPAK